MKKVVRNLFVLVLMLMGCSSALAQETTEKPRIETTYDSVIDQTTVRLLPVKISGERDKYYSLHMSPSYTYPGKQAVGPAIIDFELETVVKGRLDSDLYVVFIIDGETIFLSSNRWAVKQPIPGRVWMGERLVFHMPYEILLKLARARKVEIKMDAVRFPLGEPEIKLIKEFAATMKKQFAPPLVLT